MQPFHLHQFTLRQATNDDIGAIQHVVFTVLEEYGLTPDPSGKDADINDVETNFITPNGFFGVVLDNDIVIGTIGLYRISDTEAELRKMYVLPHYRGAGIGKWMLETVIGIARDKGYQQLTLETISPLKEAIALYSAYGFKETVPKEINERVDRAFVLQLH